MSGAHHMHMFHLPMLSVKRYAAQPEYLFMKRALDILLSSVAIIITSPIFIVTAIAIKDYDRGPVFYKQKRLTINGKEFNEGIYIAIKHYLESSEIREKLRLGICENRNDKTSMSDFYKLIQE